MPQETAGPRALPCSRAARSSHTGTSARPGTASGPGKLGQSKAGQAPHPAQACRRGQGLHTQHTLACAELCECEHRNACWGRERGRRRQPRACDQASGCPPAPQTPAWLRPPSAGADGRLAPLPGQPPKAGWLRDLSSPGQLRKGLPLLGMSWAKETMISSRQIQRGQRRAPGHTAEQEGPLVPAMSPLAALRHPSDLSPVTFVLTRPSWRPQRSPGVQLGPSPPALGLAHPCGAHSAQGLSCSCGGSG